MSASASVTAMASAVTLFAPLSVTLASASMARFATEIAPAPVAVTPPVVRKLRVPAPAGVMSVLTVIAPLALSPIFTVGAVNKSSSASVRLVLVPTFVPRLIVRPLASVATTMRNELVTAAPIARLSALNAMLAAPLIVPLTVTVSARSVLPVALNTSGPLTVIESVPLPPTAVTESFAPCSPSTSSISPSTIAMLETAASGPLTIDAEALENPAAIAPAVSVIASLVSMSM